MQKKLALISSSSVIVVVIALRNLRVFSFLCKKFTTTGKE